MARAAFLPALAVASMLAASLLTGCGSTRHALPTYEPPLARTNLQNVRTTAYTHTEADHLEYGNHNALGGTLHAAAPPVAGTTAAMMVISTAPAANPDGQDDNDGGFHARTGVPTARAVSPHGQTWQEALQASAPVARPRTVTRTATTVQTQTWPVVPTAPVVSAPTAVYGSAAADWSRWPAGTTFRIVSTGQLYRVDDYGWALSGRNTIDLYQPTRAAMNAWGVRVEPIQILQWGDREESLRRLRNHQGYRHIRRMVLELEGHDRAAAGLE